MYDVVVIGGGAAGMMAAIAASREGASVILLEHMDCCGKKILSTGNGRCNYTNKMQGIEYYRGDDPAFVLPALEQFGYEKTIAFFRSIGVEPKEKNGYVYPRSMQASSVREALLLELKKNGVKIAVNIGIRSILPQNGHYEICTKNGDFSGKTCILATGGKSVKSTGSDGSGFLYLVPLSHNLSDLVPALTGMQAKQPFSKDLAGIRAEAKVNLFVENAQIAQDTGEIQLTDYGLSGIPVFQVSRYAAKALQRGENVRAEVNFLPDYSKSGHPKPDAENRPETNELAIIRARFASMGERSALEVLNGLLNSRLSKVLLERAGIPAEKKAAKCSEREITKLTQIITRFSYEITGVRKFDQSQVTAGGVRTSEIHAKTMESKFHPGLYFAGEVMDIDGMCGGYNLQWAWSSGYIAGVSAAKKSAHS